MPACSVSLPDICGPGIVTLLFALPSGRRGNVTVTSSPSRASRTTRTTRGLRAARPGVRPPAASTTARSAVPVRTPFAARSAPTLEFAASTVPSRTRRHRVACSPHHSSLPHCSVRESWAVEWGAVESHSIAIFCRQTGVMPIQEPFSALVRVHSQLQVRPASTSRFAPRKRTLRGAAALPGHAHVGGQRLQALGFRAGPSGHCAAGAAAGGRAHPPHQAHRAAQARVA